MTKYRIVRKQSLGHDLRVVSIYKIEVQSNPSRNWLGWSNTDFDSHEEAKAFINKEIEYRKKIEEARKNVVPTTVVEEIQLEHPL